MRIALVSKACLVGAYQRKLEELAALPDIDLTVIVPPSWRDERGTIALEREHVNGYRLIAMIAAASSPTRLPHSWRTIQ